MDRPGSSLGGIRGQAAGEPANEVREAYRLGSRLSEIRSAIGEISNRLSILNERITGERAPDSNKTPAPESNALAAIVKDLENLAGDCSRMTQAIEANIG